MSAAKLSKSLATLILMGVKEAGSYDPAKALSRIEESLTLDDYKQAEAFLAWAHQNNKMFGHGNIDAVYAEYRRAHPAERQRG